MIAKKWDFGGLQIKGFSFVSNLLSENGRAWKVDVLYNLFPPWIVDEILRIPLSCIPGHDKLLWSYTKNGRFTVKSCYYFLHQQKVPMV